MKYLIVGAGVFGASTAFHLKGAHPEDEVILLDREQQFPCPSAAGHDLNKILRMDYEDPFYLKLAMEALKLWKSDPVLKTFYHETGIVYASGDPGEKETRMLEEYNANRDDSRPPATRLTPRDMEDEFGGIFRDGDWKDTIGCTWNRSAGWADAEEALRAVIQAARNLGVEYQARPVQKIWYDDKHDCKGVIVGDGEEIPADKVILCTGADTAELLASSAPKRRDLQVGDKLTAAGAVMGLFRVPTEERAKFASAPVIVHCVGELGAESIPPGKKGLLKCIHEQSFTNLQHHEASDQSISMPPKPKPQSEWSHDVPQALKDEIHAICQKVYGSRVEGQEPEAYRMCWDTITPTQDFLIDQLPAQGLYIASGGSFHGWKFLTNIGIYVTQMLDGKLDGEKATRWAWSRSVNGANCAGFRPSRDLKNI